MTAVDVLFEVMTDQCFIMKIPYLTSMQACM